MPKPISFKDRNELIARLGQMNWARALKRAHDKEDDLGPLTAVYASVTRSTYRAFRSQGSYTPSGVFRNWAAAELYNCGLSRLRGVRSNRQYRIWAMNLAEELSETWRKYLPSDPLSVPKALKLVNLLAKGLCAVSPLWPDQSKLVIEHLDVPLDQFSLQPLACMDKWGWLRGASMGHVKTVKSYEEIQAAIRDLGNEARKPPIAYDFLTWDGAHKKKSPKRSEC